MVMRGNRTTLSRRARKSGGAKQLVFVGQHLDRILDTIIRRYFGVVHQAQEYEPEAVNVNPGLSCSSATR